MGVAFHSRGETDAHSFSHRRGVLCFCGVPRGLPVNANKEWETLTHDDIRKFFHLSLTSYGIPIRLPFSNIRHNVDTFLDEPYPRNLCNNYVTFLEFQFFLNLNIAQLRQWCALVDRMDFTLYPPNIDYVFVDPIDSTMGENNHVLNTSMQSQSEIDASHEDSSDSLDFLFV